VRTAAQSALSYVFNMFVFSNRIVIDDVVQLLQVDNNDTHHQFKVTAVAVVVADGVVAILVVVLAVLVVVLNYDGNVGVINDLDEDDDCCCRCCYDYYYDYYYDCYCYCYYYYCCLCCL